MKGNALWEETQYDEIYKENASKCIDKMCSMQQQYNILSKFLKVLVLQSQCKGQDNKLHCTVWTQCLNQLPIFGQKKSKQSGGLYRRIHYETKLMEGKASNCGKLANYKNRMKNGKIMTVR